METEFTASITLGTAGMNTAADIVRALRDIATHIENGEWHPGHTQSIYGAASNARVGSYKLPAGTEA